MMSFWRSPDEIGTTKNLRVGQFKFGHKVFHWQLIMLSIDTACLVCYSTDVLAAG
jgi:hypothetical protein